ncbi:MAG: hypothetical protein BGO31_01070 [Bacteroidetes bacterium 43-16]|nr:MAG: hypothetical protein BGO31_01070 [Bacteroidetes bacterium 43-16]
MSGLKNLFITLSGLCVACSIGACNLSAIESGKGAIVLGDSSTIVTENDSQYLEDAIIDLEDSTLKDNVRSNEDSFNNVAKAQQLAQQQKQDSIARLKAAEEKQKDADATAKKKEDKRKQEEKDKKKNVKDKKQTASQKKKAEEDKKKRRR